MFLVALDSTVARLVAFADGQAKLAQVLAALWHATSRLLCLSLFSNAVSDVALGFQHTENQ
jgi:hypothetical protein